MASSLSSSSWSYLVFPSFHEPDLGKSFMNYLRDLFKYNGIMVFDDQGIERGTTIAPGLLEAIRKSRIAIVVISPNYVSSSWCMDELFEILKCKEEIGQKVMPVFYKVGPSDVRKPTGEFGRVFNETCADRTKEERRRWSQALTKVSNIPGERIQKWQDICKVIQKLSLDVLNSLTDVGIEPHLEQTQSLLDVESDEETEEEALLEQAQSPLHFETDEEQQPGQTQSPLHVETEEEALLEQTQSPLHFEIDEEQQLEQTVFVS